MLCAPPAWASAPPSILNNSNHLADYAAAALTVLGIPSSGTAGPSATTLAVNQSCPGACGNAADFLPPGTIIRRATDLAQAEYAMSSSQPVRASVPYQVINHSQAGYTLAGFEQPYYQDLQSNGIIYAMAFCGMARAEDYPPVAFVTVLPNNSPAAPTHGTAPACGYAPGIEFSLPVNSRACTSTCQWVPIPDGVGIDVSSPSTTTEAMSALLAALKSRHPDWTWGDVKSVLRSTASNWRSGYRVYSSVGPGYGYGNVSYPAARGYTGTIYLQPPGMTVQANPGEAVIRLYPFVTTRRAGEIVCAFAVPPVFPPPGSNDEYTYAQVSSLLRQFEGTIVYRSPGASGQQTVSHPVAGSPTLYFVGFTVDNAARIEAAHFSRAESYSVIRVPFPNAPAGAKP